MIGNRFYTWFKNYYQWVGGAFNETLLLPLVRATAGLRAGAIRYDETTNTVETYDGTNWNPIPSATGFVPNSRTITINGTTFDLSTNRIYSVGTVTSVGLSMPAAFTVSGSPVTGAGTLSVTGAGLATQYVRGDGTLANFPTSQGGGSSVSYYLNGSVNQGTIGGNTYYELNRTPVLGAGTNFSRNTDGYIASFITDANDPALTEIPGGNFNLELYFSASSGGGNPSFYVELYKYDGTTFSLIASNSTSPDSIVGATKDAYFTAIAVPQTALTITDRLAIRVYVNTSGRTITLHTEDQNLCQVITTFSTGINTINGLTKQVQFLTTGTTGTDFNINSTNSTHTFNIPTASATNRGALSSSDWTTFNNKVGTSRQLTINGTAFDLSADRTWSVGTVTSVGLNTGSAGTDINVSGSPVNVSGNITLNIPTASATNRGALSAADWAIFNAKQNALTLTTTGNSGASTLVGSTLNVPEYTISGLGGVPTTRQLTINGTAFDLSANRSWSVGTVTSVGLTSSTSGITITDSPVTVSGTIGIAIATANGSQQGLLSSTDWTTFNNKQNTLSLTTTGTSGAATLIGATLNVPQYQAQGNYITSLTGEATASGPGATSVTLSTTAVTSKLLTGLNLSGGGTIAATDSILTAFGKVQNQISAMVGGVMYQGTWNASTNTPTLTSSVGVKGYYYIVDVSGTTNLNGITDWRVGDWAIFNGSTWDKVDNTDAVSSVNGFTGAVSLTTSHIAEGTNLYYLDSRSRTAISLTTTGSSGAATYDNVSGIINVPQYTLAGLGGVPTTRQLTINGTAFDLSADRSWSVGTVTSVGLNSTTSGITITNTPVTSSGALTINIATASGSQNGLLSSTDWNSFNTGLGELIVSVAFTPTDLQLTKANSQVIGATVPLANGSQVGFLSTTDYNTFNNKIGGSGTSGQVAYFNGTNSVTGESNLFWDAANDRLGIGVAAPTVALDVAGAGRFSGSVTASTFTSNATSGIFLNNGSGGTNATQIRINNTGGDARMGVESSTGGTIQIGTSAYAAVYGNQANAATQFTTNGTVRMTIDPSGNLGLGVTPSAWSLGRAFEVGNVGNGIWNYGVSNTNIVTNTIWNLGQKYASNGAATMYAQNNGNHEWLTAPSGTAGNAISFTQAMTLDASGRLGIGETNPTRKLDVLNSANAHIARFTGGASSNINIGIFASNALGFGSIGTQSNHGFNIYTNDIDRLYITSGGNVGIGTQTPVYRLDINGVTRFQDIVRFKVNDWNKSDDGFNRLYFANAGRTFFGSGGGYEWRSDGDGALMVLTNSGNVGIGTTTPENASGYATMTINGSSGGQITFATTNSKKGYLYNNATNMYIGAESGALIFDAGAIERMRITSGGAVEMTGTIKTGAPSGGTAQPWKLGSVGTQSLTQSRYVEVEINGTTYWLLATDVQV